MRYGSEISPSHSQMTSYFNSESKTVYETRCLWTSTYKEDNISVYYGKVAIESKW